MKLKTITDRQTDQSILHSSDLADLALLMLQRLARARDRGQRIDSKMIGLAQRCLAAAGLDPLLVGRCP